MAHHGRHMQKWLVFGGIALRVMVWWFSIGSNDAHIWAGHARSILDHGLVWTYENVQIMNHPPLMGWWSAVANTFGPDMWTFSLWLRVPGLLGDIASVGLLWRFASPSAAAVYALAPVAILVTSYHANTDGLCTVAILAGAFALDRQRWFLAGTAIAAALNVKLIPLVLLPVVFACVPDMRALVRLAGGLALAIIPYLSLDWTVLRRNLLGYSPITVGLAEWGVTGLLSGSARAWYASNGKWIMLAAMLALAVFGRVQAMRPSVQLALALSLFVLLVPGFGVQYLLYPTALLCAADLAAAIAWSVVGGAFAISVYAAGLQVNEGRAFTWMPEILGAQAYRGVVAWCGLAWAAHRSARTSRGVPESAQVINS